MYRRLRSDEDIEYLERLREIVGGNLGQLPPRPTQLLPHVFLGSQLHAENLRLLRKLGVTHVLNTAGYKGPRENPHANPYEGLNIHYLEFLADDEDNYDMSQHFPDAFRYLDDVKARGGVCLVHCALGINRSSCVCAAYLMHEKRWPLLEVMRFLKSERGLVLTNLGFQRQLVAFARRMRLLDQLPQRKKPEEELEYVPYRGRSMMMRDLEVEDENDRGRRYRSRYLEEDMASIRRVHVSPMRYGARDRNTINTRTASLPRSRTDYMPDNPRERNEYGSSNAYAMVRDFLLGGSK